MVNSKYIEAKNAFVNQLQKKLGKDLLAVISVGSEPNGELVDGWSDLDFLIIVSGMGLDIKRKLAQAILTVEKESNIHIGVNIISQKEATNPPFPTINLEGKTLQALLELSMGSSKLLFSKIPSEELYKPSEEEIKEYSLNNIKMLLRRNRIALIRHNSENLEVFKSVVAKEIRAAYIMAKLAVQYFTLETITSDKKLVQRAKEVFEDFDFKVLETSNEYINEWGSTPWKEEELRDILSKTNDFIESFSDYVYTKASLIRVNSKAA